jgi:hypothetical protein
MPICAQPRRLDSGLQWRKQRCSREVKSLHQSANRFQYQINQPRQLFEITLFRRNQKFTSIRQSLPISNQSAETVLWNNAVPEKSKVYINPSIASNIKSISQDSCLKQRCSGEIKSLHQSANRFQYQIIHPRQLFETTLFRRSQKFTSIRQSLPISNQSAKTVVWNNAVPEKSKVYINPSVASNIKSISQDSCLKQRCSREVILIRQSLPISNHLAENVVWNSELVGLHDQLRFISTT